MPSLERSLQRMVVEASMRAGLKTYTPNTLSVSIARLVFQKKVVLEQGVNRRNSKESFIEMDEDDDLKNVIKIKMD
jgi:hypothetical protein